MAERSGEGREGRAGRYRTARARGAWSVALALAFGGAAHAEEVDPGLAELGAQTYQRRCAACHGEDARGGGPVAKALREEPSDLTRIAARREGVFPSGEIARAIDGRFDVTAHGTRRMPVWGERLVADLPEARLAEEISRGTIASLVEYLKTLQVDVTDATDATDAAEDTDAGNAPGGADDDS